MDKSKILIESNGSGKMHIEVEGNKVQLMKLLAELARKLINNTNLSKEDVLFATELGLKDDEELEKESERAIRELPKKIEKLLNELFDIQGED